MFFRREYLSKIGKIIMLSNGTELTALYFDGQKNSPQLFETAESNLEIFKETKNWLDIYFSGEKPSFIPKINPEGSEFRKRVWKILLEIPYGQSISYGKIAKKIAEERKIAKISAQAVGGAVGHNPVAIIIPCHRVLGADKSLTGYAGGLERKIALLKLEKCEFKE